MRVISAAMPPSTPANIVVAPTTTNKYACVGIVCYVMG